MWGRNVAHGKNKLTAVQIRKSDPGVLQDGGGLSLRKTETGGRWNYRYSLAGKRRDMGLGSLDDVTLAEARQIRDKWSTVLLDGKDPVSERSRVKEAEKAEMGRHDPTLADMVDVVFEAKKDGLRGNGVNGRWRSPIDLHVLPKIGHMPISTIHQTDIQKALAPIWRKKHPTATKAIQRLEIIFRQARLSGLEVDPFTVEAAKHMLGEVRHVVEPITATPWQNIPELYQNLEGNAPSRLPPNVERLITRAPCCIVTDCPASVGGTPPNEPEIAHPDCTALATLCPPDHIPNRLRGIGQADMTNRHLGRRPDLRCWCEMRLRQRRERTINRRGSGDRPALRKADVSQPPPGPSAALDVFQEPPQ